MAKIKKPTGQFNSAQLLPIETPTHTTHTIAIVESDLIAANCRRTCTSSKPSLKTNCVIKFNPGQKLIKEHGPFLLFDGEDCLPFRRSRRSALLRLTDDLTQTWGVGLREAGYVSRWNGAAETRPQSENNSEKKKR